MLQVNIYHLHFLDIILFYIYIYTYNIFLLPHGNIKNDPSGLQSGLRTNVNTIFSSKNNLKDAFSF